MKLFSTYNRVLLFTSIFGLLIIGYSFYHTLSHYLNKQIDSYLVEELLEVKDYTQKRKIFPAHEVFEDLVIDYKKITKIERKRNYADTVFFNPKKGIKESGRYLKEDVNLAGQNYSITIIASKIAHIDQVKSIFLVIILPVLGLLIIILLVNRYMMKRLWLPFRQLLLNLKSFNLNQEGNFEQVNTSILEFKELNDAIVDISQRVKSDYKEIKLFTENASHEMMTPIAIINSKLDMMLQSNEINEEQSQNLIDLYKATSKLTKLNQSLLLLVKIDNNLLRDKEYLNIKELVQGKMQYFQEFIQKKNIKIEQQLEDNYLSMSKYLADILLDNLIGNAIRHSQQNGLIKIELNEIKLCIKNSSEAEPLNPNNIFERFYKSPSSDGMGLGLAIVKQIAGLHQFDITYAYQDKLHIFCLTF